MSDWTYVPLPNWWRCEETDIAINDEDLPDELRPQVP